MSQLYWILIFLRGLSMEGHGIWMLWLFCPSKCQIALEKSLSLNAKHITRTLFFGNEIWRWSFLVPTFSSRGIVQRHSSRADVAWSSACVVSRNGTWYLASCDIGIWQKIKLGGRNHSCKARCGGSRGISKRHWPACTAWLLSMSWDN